MKTSVRIMFRPAVRRKGTGTLALRITRQRVTRAISMPYVLSSGEWDDARQKIVCLDNSHPKRKKELAAISSKMKKDLQLILNTAAMLEDRGNYSSQDLVDSFREQQQGQLLCEYIKRKAEKLREANRFGTAHLYEYSAVSFLKFLDNRDVRVEKINSFLIKSYERYLQENGKSKNTIASYMRLLRAAYNEIMNTMVFTEQKAKPNPFLGVFTGNAKTQKRAIAAESISQIMDVNFEEEKDLGEANKKFEGGIGRKRKEKGKKLLVFSRDLFLFSLFTQGMSFADMVNLKKENMKGDTLRYNRKKTGQVITVKLENYTKAIIDRYVDPQSDYFFPVLRAFKDCDGFTQWKAINTASATYNRNLNKLAQLSGIETHLTGYVPRHTWASLASQEGASMATISRGMGHESEKTTRIYVAQLDYSDVEEANKKILLRLTDPLPPPV